MVKQFLKCGLAILLLLDCAIVLRAASLRDARPQGIWMLTADYHEYKGKMEPMNGQNSILLYFKGDSLYALDAGKGFYANKFEMRGKDLYGMKKDSLMKIGHFAGSDTLILESAEGSVGIMVRANKGKEMSSDKLNAAIKDKQYMIHFADFFERDSPGEEQVKYNYGGQLLNHREFDRAIYLVDDQYFILIDVNGERVFQVIDVTDGYIEVICLFPKEHKVRLNVTKVNPKH